MQRDSLPCNNSTNSNDPATNQYLMKKIEDLIGTNDELNNACMQKQTLLNDL